MKVNQNLLAPCGLYCGVCGIYFADKHNNEKLKQRLAEIYGMKPESLKCDGCLSDNRIVFCEACKIRNCVSDKRISGCHQCSQFPCDNIKKYPFKVAIPFMLRSTSFRKGKTNAEWVKWEEQNWKCKTCGAPAFRGARRCHECGNELLLTIEQGK
jgi:hypothetical protein